jgi:hypothetical protein
MRALMSDHLSRIPPGATFARPGDRRGGYPPLNGLTIRELYAERLAFCRMIHKQAERPSCPIARAPTLRRRVMRRNRIGASACPGPIMPAVANEHGRPSGNPPAASFYGEREYDSEKYLLISPKRPFLMDRRAKRTSTDQNYMGPPVLFAPSARQRSAREAWS